MRARRTVARLVALAAPLVAAAGACFPDYAFVDGGPGEGGGGDDAPLDHTLGDGGGDGSDGTSSGGDAEGGASDSGDGAPATDADLDGMVTLGGGLFTFSISSAANGSLEDASASLTYTLAIDEEEVSVGGFTAWVDAGMPLPCSNGATSCSLDTSSTQPYAAIMRWQPTWNTLATSQSFTPGNCYSDNDAAIITYGAGHADYPMNCVTWYAAVAFCAWHGKRLPTETEWRYVATAGGARRDYPWAGLQADCSHAIWDESGGGNSCGFPKPFGTTTSGASASGALDIVGDVTEWVWDYVSNSYVYPVDAGTNYAGPAPPDASDTTTSRGFIGGWWGQASSYFLEVGQQDNSGDPTGGYDGCGFRCARTVP